LEQKGSQGVRNESFENLTLENAEAILHKVPGILQLSPVVRASAQIKFRNQNNLTPVTGAAITYFPIRNFTLQSGRKFTEIETRQNARVAVIGSQTANDLFQGKNPLEKMVKVNGLNFKIIGQPNHYPLYYGHEPTFWSQAPGRN